MTIHAGTSDHLLARGGSWVGTSVRRREDPRLLTGTGRFVDDISLPGMVHAQFVRSTIAAGKILSIDLGAAQSIKGVRAAWDADDLALGNMVATLDRPLTEFVPTEMPILASDTVRFVGEPLAIVVATDQYLAEDALEAVTVRYEPGVAVTTIDEALATGAPLVHEQAAHNTLVDVSLFDSAGTDEAFASAAVVVSVHSKTGRQNALPMETRGALAYWDDRDEQLVLYTCSQVPHLVRTVTARSLGLDERKVRVIVPDMGGGFGIKCVVGREEIAVAAAALRLRRPVKWTEDRREALTASFLAREQRYDVRAAFDETGRLLAIDADVVCDMGAYSCYPFTAAIEPLMASSELPGVYKLPDYRVRGRAIASNKAPSAPYRGVSRPQYVMVVERLMERAARELNIDPVEIRRRNLITVFPYTGVNNITYDPGSYLESLNLCEETLRREGWFDLRDREAGRHIGIGFSCFNERTGYGSAAFAARKMDVVPGFDVSDITMDMDGTVVVTTGTLSHGQSHETTMAQIVADRLGLDIEQVKIHQGDTDRILYGYGSFASRSITIGGSAVALAAVKLGDKLRDIAAHLLDTHIDNVQLDKGRVRRVDDPSVSLSYRQLADIAYAKAHLLPKGLEPGLRASASFDVDNDGTFSNATHGAVVEVFEGTGDVKILRYFCVEDCGVAINPTVVEGQARGGIAQGIAGALFEEVTYDSTGQPLVASFIDYRVPTACEIPDIGIAHLETPCLFTESGAKGAGEGGTIGAPAAILNAVNDALRHTEVELDDTPIPIHAVAAALSRVHHDEKADDD
ncbi:xanthine dehydrogenase family protein molybdopterin-binding subunit [Mycolicibacterium smegmatis]|uniref:xanthine dehydrogenase family protein molybdopterin-binding subunit n=1 Tax=Mycolicibacterium smegmatis TaxID=1772 RepID=UPI001E2ACEA1|nr:xanthine dehydrogenase family protein molybdopterin-binding subunit [Mycolicibacterium smegmatis]UGT77773.1 xanthine dehydrogenase family protein molybdopterin-binding subunit [Mycolicibacterium smegmatis]